MINIKSHSIKFIRTVKAVMARPSVGAYLSAGIPAAGVLALFASLMLPTPALAESGLPLVNALPTAGGGQSYTLSLQTLILLTSLTFLPAAC